MVYFRLSVYSVYNVDLQTTVVMQVVLNGK